MLTEAAYTQRLARINQICGKYELAFELMFYRKNKLLLGGSFDSMYYFQFFILFTGVKKNPYFQALEPGAHRMHFLHLHAGGLHPDQTHYETHLQYRGWDTPDPPLLHTDIFYYAPEKPYFTFIGQGNDPDRQPVDFTRIVNGCFFLEDHFEV